MSAQRIKKKQPTKQRQPTRRRMYGFFLCNPCLLQWESPDTIQLANGRYIAQFCSDCDRGIIPFKTAALCRSCSDFPCKCSQIQGRAKAKRARARPSRPKIQNGRVYGYYRCSECRRGWESAYTFVQGGKAQHGQKCKSCRSNKYHKAYDWKALQKTCSKCKTLADLKDEQCVKCGNEFDDDDNTRNDPMKNHIQELCARCRNRDKPCSARY